MADLDMEICNILQDKVIGILAEIIRKKSTPVIEELHQVLILSPFWPIHKVLGPGIRVHVIDKGKIV